MGSPLGLAPKWLGYKRNFNGKRIKNEGRYFSEVVKHQNLFKIVLELDDPQPSDAGVYLLVAKNQAGSSELPVTFKLDGKFKEKYYSFKNDVI